MVAYEFTPLEITRCASACLPRRCASTAGAASAPLGFESRYSRDFNGAYDFTFKAKNFKYRVRASGRFKAMNRLSPGLVK